MIRIKTEEEIQYIAESCRIIKDVFKVLNDAVTEGMTTRDLEGLAVTEIQRHRGRPAFKGYRGYPGGICVSVDREVVHGIPGRRKLRAGQLVSVDVGVEKNGYYGDAARTYAVGTVSADRQQLMRTTEEALLKGIAQAGPGHRVGDISRAVQEHVEAQGFSVVRDLVGHGVGRQLHEDPQIPNYVCNGKNPRIKPGMTFAIEPMVNAGDYRVEVLEDGWTVVTADGSCSAHCEDTVVIDEGGARNLTR